MPTQKDTTSAVSSACRRTLSSITSNRFGLENPGGEHKADIGENEPKTGLKLYPTRKSFIGVEELDALKTQAIHRRSAQVKRPTAVWP